MDWRQLAREHREWEDERRPRHLTHTRADALTDAELATRLEQALSDVESTQVEFSRRFRASDWGPGFCEVRDARRQARHDLDTMEQEAFSRWLV